MGHKIHIIHLKRYFVISQIIIILNLILLSNVLANEREKELNLLFKKLKTGSDELTHKTEQKIWKLWSTHPNNDELTSMLSVGSDFLNNNQYPKAVEIFTKVIELDPSWAEAWNKRATVLYMMGEFEKSQDDIDKVLKLEKRHFGALAGQGLVNIKLENYEKALMSYEEAMKIYPSMNSPKIMIKELKELIKNQSI